MGDKFRELFVAISETAISVSDTAIKYAKENNAEQSLENANRTREYFDILKEKLKAKEELDKFDYQLLYLQIEIVINFMRQQITQKEKVIEGYNEKVVPALLRVIEASDDDYAAVAEKEFSLEY